MADWISKPLKGNKKNINMAEEQNIAQQPESQAAAKAASDNNQANVRDNGRPQGRPQGQGGRKSGGHGNDRGGHFGKKEGPVDPFQEQVVAINKVTKVVKGGKHMRFAALVVIGDGKGRFGFGQGKSLEVPVAIKKALEYAHNTLYRVPIVKGATIPHAVRGKCGVTEVFLKPAPDGTGVIAGGAVRSICQLVGIKNIYSKVYGRRTPINVIRATIDAVSQLKTKEYVDEVRFGIVPEKKGKKGDANRPSKEEK